MEIAIKTKNLTKKFGKLVAVDNLNFEVYKNETFALLGLNGAGKTTAIKMLCCLLKTTSGDAFLQGHSINTDCQNVKKIINISPQEIAVAPNLTIKENLELIANLYNNDKEFVKEKVESLILSFGLTKKINDRAKSLSGGMQRRLSIAMALVSEPQILFLDEPTLGLDVKARRELWKIITNLKSKITIILTTHYLEEVEFLADRVGIMKSGKLVDIGSVEELKQKTKLNSLEEVFLQLTDDEVEE